MKPWLIFSLLTLFFWSIWSPLISFSTHVVKNPFRVIVFESVGFLAALLPLLLFVRLGAEQPSQKADALAFGAGFFAAFGTLTIIYAFKAGGKPEIVAPLVSLSPALTVLWMWWFFSAQLNYTQILGITLAIIAGIILAR
ncbi:MAG TPA: EamA family transporter [Candidatus Hypogeohydataceae bacterium YC41]